MKLYLVLTIVFGLAHVEHVVGVRKCSLEVIAKINQLWADEGIPTDLIKQAVAAGKQNIILTSAGYYPEGTTCAYTLFAKDGKTVKLTTVKGKEASERTEKNYESGGIVMEEGTGIKRYHVFSQDGVAAWYKCGNGDDATVGKPEGAIKVPNGPKYNKELVADAKKKLESVGVVLTDNYNSYC
ncbi:uncharacterized protein LOC128993408 [Macrosteles quadrilineatus]|uniref:uncharacterized protein LOC128993408 n=1 Tax=Macrosteles quadrilineatus TaxID=74068 RepID=UPI0023E2139B|nr:uncharacterized protein LOC128993408 [Macrosteles quadrilineatus]